MEIKDATEILAALAHENRLEIFRLLVQSMPNGMAVGEIGSALGLPGATLSFHLNHLKQAGVVSVERQGRSLIYRVEFATMQQLLTYIMEDCCQGKLCC